MSPGWLSLGLTHPDLWDLVVMGYLGARCMIFLDQILV